MILAPLVHHMAQKVSVYAAPQGQGTPMAAYKLKPSGWEMLAVPKPIDDLNE